MTFREIYEAALRIICENSSSEETADYEERAPYILATFCNECAPIEKAYCKAHNLQFVSIPALTQIAMIDYFPLRDRFSSAVIYYLCAMLVIDENEELSDKFFSRYTDTVSLIQAATQQKLQEIKEQEEALKKEEESNKEDPSAPSAPSAPPAFTLEKIVNRYPFF
jgi:hypothetical protein